MSAVFVAGLDFRGALGAVARAGAAFVPEALEESFRVRLQREVEVGPFRPLPEEVGPVRQRAEAYEIRDRVGRFPALMELRRALVREVREHGREIRGLATWRPNEASVQRYGAGWLGVTPHVDGRRYRRLVAVFTTSGTASFAICRDRAGEVVADWEAGPGSLVLLRGPGLGGLRDGRPFHRVGGPAEGWRYSVGFRMNTSPGPG